MKLLLWCMSLLFDGLSIAASATKCNELTL
jgi:hypothetical protein